MPRKRTVSQWGGGGRAPGLGGLVLRAGEADGGRPASEVPRSAVGTDCSVLPLFVMRNATHPDSSSTRFMKKYSTGTKRRGIWETGVPTQEKAQGGPGRVLAAAELRPRGTEFPKN